jgi:sterol desaturase/sphingolipid hydroxylase (fatty acid hydroxylase superfamily)
MISLSFVSPLLIVGAALIIIVLERLLPYSPSQHLFRKGFFNDLVFYSLLQSYLLGYAIAWLAALIDLLTGISRYRLLSHFTVAQTVLLSLVAHDFYIYWFHRLQHANRYLWRIHEAHHSVEDVDWLAGSRSHSLEILINQSVEYAPLILLGAAPEALIIKATIDACWGMYIHSNIDIRSGYLQYFINGPEMHRWHHAKEITEGGLNYSTKFAVWDWIFRTAYLPAERKPSGYGIGDRDFPHGYLAQHLYAFRRRKQ